MAGAYLLAEALHETTTSQEAFQCYEQQMHPLVLAQQKQARRFAAFFLPGTPLALFVQQMPVKVVSGTRFAACCGAWQQEDDETDRDEVCACLDHLLLAGTNG